MEEVSRLPLVNQGTSEITKLPSNDKDTPQRVEKGQSDAKDSKHPRIIKKTPQ